MQAEPRPPSHRKPTVQLGGDVARGSTDRQEGCDGAESPLRLDRPLVSRSSDARRQYHRTVSVRHGQRNSCSYLQPANVTAVQSDRYRREEHTGPRFFQSWKYTVGVESALRYHLRLLPNVSAAIHDYLNQIRPPAWKGQSFSRIGIHARAGDIMRRRHCRFGFTIPQRPYFERAMARFVDERRQRGGGRVQFIVTSDRLAWVKRAFNFTSIAQRLNRTSSPTKDKVVVEVAHSEGHDAGFDLGLLSLCDGVIMSTGSYGWWAAWLANKTTIYYSNWPRPGSGLFNLSRRGDIFPPNWIPIGGPMFQCYQY